MDTALTALEQALADKKRNLSPEERQRFGSINETNKLFVNKVFGYCKSQPDFCGPDVDWPEFEADFQDRNILETRIARIRSLLEAMENMKILHDYDNFQNALVDYSYTQYKKDTAAGGFVTKYNALKQFFTRTASVAPAAPAN